MYRHRKKVCKIVGLTIAVHLGHSALAALYGRMCIAYIFGVIPVAHTGILCQCVFYASSWLHRHIIRITELVFK